MALSNYCSEELAIPRTADFPGVGSIGSEALSGTEIETLGRQMSEAQQAFSQVLDAEDGYDQPQMQRVFDDDRFPTRLGIPQVTLRLAREAGGRLVPWAGSRPRCGFRRRATGTFRAWTRTGPRSRRCETAGPTGCRLRSS